MKELDIVVLTEDLPNHNLRTGDTGTIVFNHENDKAYEVEFLTFTGDTVAVVTLESHQIRRVSNQEIPCVRVMINPPKSFQMNG